MKLTLEQFETQFADNNLSVTDWFDTTYGLFKELEALDRSRREWYQKGYAEAEYECKAKDEKLKQLDEAYSKVASDFESAVMEIERLKAQLSSVHNLMYRNGYSDAIDCYDTFGKFNTKHKPNAKARSIVAMLFWRTKRQKAIYVKSFNDLGINNHNTSFYKGAYENSKMRFKQAYKMLKDIK